MRVAWIFQLRSLFLLSVLALGTSAHATLIQPGHADAMRPPTPVCDLLDVGEGRIIKEHAGSPLLAHYLLIRQDRNTYRAVVDFKFVDEQGIETPEIRDPMVAKVTQCFAKANEFLQGPEGETLKLELLRRPTGYPHPYFAGVTITDKPVRSEVTKWPKSIDCATIVHETFHVLGLVDEYREGIIRLGKSAQPAYDCRAIGPADSVMNSLHVADMLLEGTATFDVQACYCRIDPKTNHPSTSCLKQAPRDIRPGSGNCPGYMIPAHGRIENYNGPGFGFDAKKRLPPEEFILSAKKEPLARTRLLYPAEFRAIIRPGCTGDNSRYYRCITQAYLTSPQAGGAAKCDSSIAVECQSPDWAD